MEGVVGIGRGHHPAAMRAFRNQAHALRARGLGMAAFGAGAVGDRHVRKAVPAFYATVPHAARRSCAAACRCFAARWPVLRAGAAALRWAPHRNAPRICAGKCAATYGRRPPCRPPTSGPTSALQSFLPGRGTVRRPGLAGAGSGCTGAGRRRAA
ncbi:hypothetical protein G6F50_015831 [Rhizopus delemar]|uniref:Uncharacterized protein n=1 Tax=Rhizopus delemar TaxID=936053 RepID=A0A9P6XW08_9FUNG|nr:hypothetical protein G6F50_015831 [Rhizopus delemar]